MLVGWLEVNQLWVLQWLQLILQLGKLAPGRGRLEVGADPANGVKRCWELGPLIALGWKEVPED